MNSIKVFIKNLSPALKEAIEDHIADISFLDIAEGLDDTDIIVSSFMPDIEGYDLVPKLILGTEQKYRLGDIVNKIVKIATHPIQYINDIALGEISFLPKEKLFIRNKQEIVLTDREVDILYYLVKNIGSEVSKEQILKDVWKYQEGIDTHTLETHIYRLRKKIEINADAPDFLVTKENGYILNVY